MNMNGLNWYDFSTRVEEVHPEGSNVDTSIFSV